MSVNIIKTNLKVNGSLSYGNSCQYGIIHHPEFNGSVEALNNMMISMGYTMMGYNYYVRKDGSIYEGRPHNAISANCYGYNSKSVGICFEGNFDVEYMNETQFKAGVALCIFLKSAGIVKDVFGPHKKYYNTACPGRNFPITKMLEAINGGHIDYDNDVKPTPEAKTVAEGRDYVGNRAKELQELLIASGYSLTYGADGKYGPETHNALIRFQKTHGLTPDGLCGTKTWEKLKNVSTNGYEAGVRKAKDYIGPRAYELQTKLIKLGYKLPKFGADGNFGQESYDALVRFQKDNGLTPDGLCGTNTWNAINSKLGGKHREASRDEVIRLQNIIIKMGYPLPTYGADGKAGTETYDALENILVMYDAEHKREIVDWIQDRLISLGYTLGSAGNDWYFGESTENAVKAFQANHGLGADGKVGINTWKKLINC